MPPAPAGSQKTTTVDLNNLEEQRSRLEPIDQTLDAHTLQIKSADPASWCLEHHPQELERCTHSLDGIVLVSGHLDEALTHYQSVRDIYLQSISLSDQLVATWSVSILVVALLVRVIYELTQLARGGMQFSALALDVVVYTTLTGAYVLVVRLIVTFYLDISSYFSSEVLLSRMRDYLGQLRTHMESRLDSSFDPISLVSVNLVETSLTVFTSFFSFFVRIFQYFVLLAHGILFTIVIIAGTIVVPVSVAGYVNLLGGWIRLCSTVVLYPVIQALMFWALLFYFDNSGLLSLDEDAVLVQTFELHFVENLINISVIAIYLIAPFATNIVVTGSGNLTGVLTPMYLAGALVAKRIGSTLTSAVADSTAKAASIARGSDGNGADNSGDASGGGRSQEEDSPSLASEASIAQESAGSANSAPARQNDSDQQADASFSSPSLMRAGGNVPGATTDHDASLTSTLPPADTSSPSTGSARAVADVAVDARGLRRAGTTTTVAGARATSEDSLSESITDNRSFSRTQHSPSTLSADLSEVDSDADPADLTESAYADTLARSVDTGADPAGPAHTAEPPMADEADEPDGSGQRS